MAYDQPVGRHDRYSRASGSPHTVHRSGGSRGSRDYGSRDDDRGGSRHRGSGIGFRSDPFVPASQPATAPPRFVPQASGVPSFGPGAPPIDLSAPVIHFGTLGGDSRKAYQDPQDAVSRRPGEAAPTVATAVPCTKEQKLRTCFIGRIPSNLEDAWLDRILQAVSTTNKLKSWRRIETALGEPSDFGFAEFWDAESLGRAIEALRDFDLSRMKGLILADLEEDDVEDGISAAKQANSFTVRVQDSTQMYIEDSIAARNDKTADHRNRSLAGQARQQLDRIVQDYNSPARKMEDARSSNTSGPAAPITQSSLPAGGPEGVTILLNIDEDLGDIPDELRGPITEEIKQFREQTRRKEQDKAHMLADLERRRAALERDKLLQRAQRDGPQDEEVQLIRRDPAKGRRGDDDAHLTAVERRHRFEDAQERTIESRAVQAERSWLTKEDRRIEDFRREEAKARSDEQYELDKRDREARHLAQLDEAVEKDKSAHLFFADREAWRRARKTDLAREHDQAERQREEEAALLPPAAHDEAEHATVAAEPMAGAQAEAREKVKLLSFKAAATNNNSANGVKRARGTEESASNAPRKRQSLTPLSPDRNSVDNATSVAEKQTPEDIVSAIPVDLPALLSRDMRWAEYDDGVAQRMQTFVAKKCAEAIGMEDEDLIGWVMQHLRRSANARASGEEAAHALEAEMTSAIGEAEEAALFVAKVWRYLLILLETKDP